MRRVVVTGLGMVTPLACGVEPTWRRLINGESGARRIETFDVSDLPAKIACQVPRGNGAEGTFDADQWMEPKEQRKVDDFIIFAMGAADQALDDAGWRPSTYEDQTKTGVMIGSGIGGLTGIAETAIVLKERGPRRVSPFFIPGRLINLASGYVSIAHGLKGPNHAVVTACSTGTHAIGDAARLVALGDAEVMVAGGAESPVSRIGMAGFVACRALSTSFNETPQRASRPYDRDRDGFVMGEGAGVVVLETMSTPESRGAKIYAELIGYGMSGDAYHITAPQEMVMARCAACVPQSRARAYLLRRSITSMRTVPRPRLETKSSLAAVQRLVGNAAVAYACPRPNLPSGICWARRGRSKPFSQFLRCAMVWRRQR